MIMVGFGLMPLICRISSNRVRLLSKSRNKNKDLSKTPTFWVQTNLNLIFMLFRNGERQFWMDALGKCLRFIILFIAL